ncbi:hypothetical protein CLV56_2200 [Mumia flava]|uniref:Tetratricopeptide repeat protein n=1 Tax=Mumia flava TaxID=1348852 RepID=A0A0B2BNM5_9ACTN|nr:hypothetical protein [Mumia flava]PJJ57958.1 hypothetical protein CLV56_2200 [Mumia flava]
MVITRDDVDRVETASGPPAERAEELVGYATSAEHELDGVTARSILVTAAELLGFAGAYDRQSEVLLLADESAGPSAIATDAVRIASLLTRGLDATEVADRLRRTGKPNPYTCHYVAESYIESGDLAKAERWLNIGLRVQEHLDPEMTDTFAWDLLLVTRLEVRRALGRPADQYDEEAQLAEPVTEDD